MDGIRHRERFAEIEALMDSYFRCHIAPVMSKTRTYLTEKQGEEMMEYSTSPGGILSLMASSMQPLADPYQVLKATGEWNSKTTEDYIEMCKAEIAGSEAMQQDLAYMAERWREAVVQEVGRERYDELSRELGCDLAYAFVDYRVEQLMIGRLVEERMPRSSSEYIIRKAAESSLLGLTQTLSRSPLAEEIERRGEAAYRPEQDRERRGQGAGRLGRRRDAGRRRVVDGAGPLRRYGRGSIGRGLAPLAGGAGTPLGGAVYQQGRLRQRRQRIRGIPPRPPPYRRRKTRSWPKPTGGCETGYRW